MPRFVLYIWRWKWPDQVNLLQKVRRRITGGHLQPVSASASPNRDRANRGGAGFPVSSHQNSPTFTPHICDKPAPIFFLKLQRPFNLACYKVLLICSVKLLRKARWVFALRLKASPTITRDFFSLLFFHTVQTATPYSIYIPMCMNLYICVGSYILLEDPDYLLACSLAWVPCWCTVQIIVYVHLFTLGEWKNVQRFLSHLRFSRR